MTFFLVPAWCGFLPRATGRVGCTLMHQPTTLITLISFFFWKYKSTVQRRCPNQERQAHYTLVTKPMHSGGPAVDAMRRGLDAK